MGWVYIPSECETKETYARELPATLGTLGESSLVGANQERLMLVPPSEVGFRDIVNSRRPLVFGRALILKR